MIIEIKTLLLAGSLLLMSYMILCSVCTTVIIGGREVKTEDDSRCCIVLLYYYDFSLFISIKYLRPLSILCVIDYWYNICSGDITSSSWLGNDNSGYSSKFLKKRQVSCVSLNFSFLNN